MYSMNKKVHKFMISYQEQFGRSPTLSEIVDAIHGLNYRSSARYALEKLLAQGLVITVFPTNYGRRYRAVE